MRHAQVKYRPLKIAHVHVSSSVNLSSPTLAAGGAPPRRLYRTTRVPKNTVLSITPLEEGFQADERLVQLLQLLVQDLHLHTHTHTHAGGRGGRRSVYFMSIHHASYDVTQ